MKMLVWVLATFPQGFGLPVWYGQNEMKYVNKTNFRNMTASYCVWSNIQLFSSLPFLSSTRVPVNISPIMGSKAICTWLECWMYSSCHLSRHSPMYFAFLSRQPNRIIATRISNSNRALPADSRVVLLHHYTRVRRQTLFREAPLIIRSLERSL